MKLVLVFDHRFYRRADGQICDLSVYNYGFFASRYLQIFNEVVVLARVADRDDPQLDRVSATEGPGLKIVPLPDWTGAAGFLKNRGRIIRTANSAINDGDAVLMIVPGGLASLLVSTLRKRNRPITLEVIGDPWDVFQSGAYDHPLRPIIRRFLAHTLRKQCRAACAASYVTSSYLQSRYPCSGLAVGISDVVLPKSTFVEDPRMYGPEPARKLVCVANMNKYKGHETLLEGLAICNRAGLLLEAVLVGGGGLRSELENKAKDLGLAGQIRFTGQLPAGGAVRQELDNADIFVLPSLTEGMPRAMLEAMARGLPCIASKVGGIPEILESDAMVPRGDALALAMKLQTIVGDSAWLTKMSRRNWQKAAEYREDVLWAKRLEFYRCIRKLNTSDFRERPEVDAPGTCAGVVESRRT